MPDTFRKIVTPTIVAFPLAIGLATFSSSEFSPPRSAPEPDVPGRSAPERDAPAGNELAAATVLADQDRDRPGDPPTKSRSPLGRAAPRFGLDRWLSSPPLEIARLAGKVVLVRWWTDGCPYCEATAPALVELDRKYRERGLVVIGVFHPKPPGDVSEARLQGVAAKHGFSFPIAVDADWSALRRWWPEHESSGWTSVSFLADAAGKVRYVHPGGEFHRGPGGGAHLANHESCAKDYDEIEGRIEALLDERRERALSEEATMVLLALADGVNEARRAGGAKAVMLSQDLSRAAQAHAEEMAERGFFAHASPDGQAPLDRLRREAPLAIAFELRENLSKAEGEGRMEPEERARGVVERWLASKGHRDNLLARSVTHAGYGFATSEKTGRRADLYVQLLAVVAGEWTHEPVAAVHPGDRWSATLGIPLRFFLKSVSSPSRRFPDPAKPGVSWLGGAPLQVSVSEGRTTLEFPKLEAGPYKLLARGPGSDGYEPLLDVTLSP